MESEKNIGKILEPDDCIQEWNENVCEGCPFMDFEIVSHPGGDSTRSTERHYCELGHWRENF